MLTTFLAASSSVKHSIKLTFLKSTYHIRFQPNSEIMAPYSFIPGEAKAMSSINTEKGFVWPATPAPKGMFPVTQNLKSTTNRTVDPANSSEDSPGVIESSYSSQRKRDGRPTKRPAGGIVKAFKTTKRRRGDNTPKYEEEAFVADAIKAMEVSDSESSSSPEPSDDENDPDDNDDVDAEDSEDEEKRERFSSMSRAKLLAQMRRTLRDSTIDTKSYKECLQIIDDLEDKARTVADYLKDYPMTRLAVKERINGVEEDLHPWGVTDTTSGPHDGMLFRVWDQCSKASNKDSSVGFLSGGAAWKWGLDNRKGRRRAIARHGNWRNRMSTVFISTTSSWREILYRVSWFENRQVKRKIKPNTKITLFNANARIAAKMPILRMKDEQRHYKVRTLYGHTSTGQNASWYKNEYLFLYHAGPKEIVATWTWDEIKRTMEANRWINFDEFRTRVMVPKYNEHEKARLTGIPVPCKASCSCCGHGA